MNNIYLFFQMLVWIFIIKDADQEYNSEICSDLSRTRQHQLRLYFMNNKFMSLLN